MKKISIFALLATIAAPAFAEEITSDLTNEQLDSIVATQDYAEPALRNPKTKFPRGLQVGLGVSATSGLNGFVGYANKNFDNFWAKRFGVRFDFATTSPIKSTINGWVDDAMDDGIDVGDGLTLGGGELKARHIGALVDFYPFGDTWFAGGIRLSAGYMTGKMGVSATLSGDTGIGSIEFELNGENYRYLGGKIMASADADWKYSGPYLGAGFDLGIVWGIKIYMDAGVVFTSKTAHIGIDVPTTGLERETSPGVWTIINPGDLGLTNDIREATREANDELSDIKFYPMVKLGFMYRF